jgi:hypothetical protein
MNAINWTSDTKQLHGTADPNRIAEALMLCANERNMAGLRYRLLSQKDGITIISNVPTLIYARENLKQYITPPNANKMLRFIDFLQSNIDTLQNSEVSDPSALGQGESFQPNQCYNNSCNLFQFFKYLESINVIPKKYKIQIVLGYIASKIPFGTNMGDIVVENESLTLHDWHIWNYIDNILVDLSLFQGGNLLSFYSEMPPWGKAKDHVFFTPPIGIAYYGRAYADLAIFNDRIRLYFKQSE